MFINDRNAVTVSADNAVGAFGADPVINKVMAAGCIGVSTACVGGVVLNVMAGAPLGALYYAGLATMSSAAAVAAVSE